MRAGVAMLCLAGGAAAQSYGAMNTSMMSTKGDAMLTVYGPDATNGLYTGSRWDWTTMISMDLLGKDLNDKARWKYRIFDFKGNTSIEQLVIGLVGEFGCAGDKGNTCGGASNGILGWESGSGTFMKIGCGSFMKTGTEYDPMMNYQRSGWPTAIVTPNSVTKQVMIVLNDTMTDGLRTWGYSLKRTYTMVSSTEEKESVESEVMLLLDSELINTGTETIYTAYSSSPAVSATLYTDPLPASTDLGTATTVMDTDDSVSVFLGATPMTQSCPPANSLCQVLASKQPGWWMPETVMPLTFTANPAANTWTNVMRGISNDIGWGYYKMDVSEQSVISVIHSESETDPGKALTFVSENIQADGSFVMPSQTYTLPSLAAGESAKWSGRTAFKLEFKPRVGYSMSGSTLAVFLIIVVLGAVGITAGHFMGAKEAAKYAEQKDKADEEEAKSPDLVV